LLSSWAFVYVVAPGTQLSRFQRVEERLLGGGLKTIQPAHPSPMNPSHYADPAYELTGEIVQSAYKPHKDDTDFVQPGTM
jgi:hypothetical protein